MDHAAESTRRFKVHARGVDAHHARFVHETSFEAAAIAYLEDFDLSEPASTTSEVRVIVNEVATGHQHCFTLDLDSGETSPCD